MADRIIKPDSGNVLELQDAGGTARIEINDGGATILKDAGGTARIEINDGGTTILNDEGGTSALIVGTDGDIYSSAWTEWGASSTVVGFSSFTEKLLGYKRIGKMVWFWFRFSGVSNANNLTFTVPYAAKNADPWVRGALNWRYDNGSIAFALGDHWYLPINSTVVTCLKADSATGWTAANNKGAIGSGFYEVESI